MGLLSKALGNAAVFVGDTIVTGLTAVCDIVDKYEDKLEKEDEKAIKGYQYKYRYTINQQASKAGEDIYTICDANDEVEYNVKGGFFAGKHHFSVTDKNGKMVGKINKAFINMRIPILEKKRRRCIIEIQGMEKFSLEYANTIDGDEYSLEDIDLDIENEEGDINFTICKNKKKDHIIKVRKLHAKNVLSRDSYAVVYNDEAYKLKAIFIALAIDLVRYNGD